MCDLPHFLKLFKPNKASFFLHVFNVLGVWGDVQVQSHASYAEAWTDRSGELFYNFSILND